MAVAVITFVIALAVIASERVHRTKVALLGAAIVVLFVGGDFDQEQAIESVDFNTIGLLAGMMILVYLTQQTGVYDYVAIRAGQLSRGRSLRLVLSLAGTTALLSAFLDNLTTILLIVPVTFLLADALDIDPMPAADHRGDRLEHRRHRDADRRPAEHHHRRRHRAQLQRLHRQPGADRRSSPSWSWSRCSTLVYRHRLQIAEENRALVMELDAAGIDPRPRRAAAHRAVLVVTILAFFAHQALHIEPATVALTGAAVALLVTSIRLEEALSKIEWPTLFFFVALFVMVGALEATGRDRPTSPTRVEDLTGGDRIGGAARDPLGRRRSAPRSSTTSRSRRR